MVELGSPFVIAETVLRILLALGCLLAAAPTHAGSRRVRVVAGPNVNDIVQNDRLTMHTIVRQGASPRIMFATPAGNSGVGLWFQKLDGKGLALEHPAKAIEADGHAGVELQLRGPSKLTVDRVMLDSMR